MLLDRSIAINRCIVAIRLNFNILNGILGCTLNYLSKFLINYLMDYLSIIKIIFDIVSRAVNAYKEKILLPQLEQINTTIEHNRISLFDNVSYNEVRGVTIAIVSQNANSAVHFLFFQVF